MLSKFTTYVSAIVVSLLFESPSGSKKRKKHLFQKWNKIDQNFFRRYFTVAFCRDDDLWQKNWKAKEDVLMDRKAERNENLYKVQTHESHEWTENVNT